MVVVASGIPFKASFGLLRNSIADLIVSSARTCTAKILLRWSTPLASQSIPLAAHEQLSSPFPSKDDP
eukprot:318469-Chlamydomonas_euryale.AAC.1